jgi:hypothetical protein
MKKFMVCWIEEDMWEECEEVLETRGFKPILFDNRAKAEILARALTNKKGVNHYVSEFNADEFYPDCEYLLVK